MAATFGTLTEFDETTEYWEDYSERLEQFFIANNINDAARQRAVMLSGCGAKTYKLFKGLVAPQKPSDISYEDLIAIMKNHQNPTPNLIAERDELS